MIRTRLLVVQHFHVQVVLETLDLDRLKENTRNHLICADPFYKGPEGSHHQEVWLPGLGSDAAKAEVPRQCHGEVTAGTQPCAGGAAARPVFTQTVLLPGLSPSPRGGFLLAGNVWSRDQLHRSCIQQISLTSP